MTLHTNHLMWKKVKAHPWWMALGVILIALALFAAWSFWGKKNATPSVITAEVVRGNVEDSVLAAGTIQAAKLLNVGAQVSGKVTKLHVKLGDVVKQGQLLAEIDAVTQQNTLKDAQAALSSAQATNIAKQSALALAQSNFDRQKYLFEHDAGSKADYENAQHALAAARTDLTASSASVMQFTVRVQTAQTNLGYTRITAPMAGTVVAIVTDEGQTVNANQIAPTIIKLAQLDTVTIQAQISEADVTRVKPGLPAYFTILGEPDQQYRATLKSIEPGPIDMISYEGRATSSNTNNAVYYNGVLDVPNPSGKLRIQMTTQVNIVLQHRKNVLLIPSGALGKREKGKHAVYSVRVLKGEKDDQTIEERQVKIGLNNRVEAEVLEGLKEGELVIVGTAKPGNTTLPPPPRMRTM